MYKPEEIKKEERKNERNRQRGKEDFSPVGPPELRYHGTTGIDQIG